MAGMQLVKAFIQILDGSKAGLIIPVQFNPTEYSLERSNTYKSTPVPGLGSPLVQFINGEATTLSMDLFIDDYTDGLAMPEGALAGPPMPAAVRILAITSLLDIDRKLHAPPTLRFVWGTLFFKAVLEKVEPQDHPLSPQRHTGARDPVGQLPRISPAGSPARRTAARIRRQDQAPPDHRFRDDLDDRRPRIWRCPRNGGASPRRARSTTRARFARATG